MRELRSAGAFAGGVVLDVVRLILRHGPVLAALLFGGLGLHDLVVEGATALSVHNGNAGLLVLMLAPMCVLVASVLALRTMAPSLGRRGPSSTRPGDDATTVDDTQELPVVAPTRPPLPRAAPRVVGDRLAAVRRRGRRGVRATAALLGDLGSLVLPFVAVYVLAGFVREDARAYGYLIALDQTLAIAAGDPDGARANGTSRLGLGSPAAVVAVVAGAVVVRWLLVRLGARDRRPWLVLPAAYVEVVWLSLVMIAALQQAEALAGEWVRQRRLSVWVEAGWSSFLDAFGPLAPIARTVAAWGTDGLVSVDRVLLLPLGWLTVAAVILGGRLGEPTVPDLRQASELARVARLRRGLAARFEGLTVAVRHLRHLGALPGLAYCLGFLLVWSSETWLWQLERAFVGPRPMPTWLALDEPLSTVNRALSLMLVLAYVAVCADRALNRTPDHAPDASALTAGGRTTA